MLQNRETAAVNLAHGIATEAWSPLAQGAALTEPAVLDAAAAHGVTPAQVVIRWHLQSGNVVIPKSVTASRMASNFDVFGFELGAEEMTAIDALERDGRTGPLPAPSTANRKRITPNGKRGPVMRPGPVRVNAHPESVIYRGIHADGMSYRFDLRQHDELLRQTLDPL